MGDGAKRLEWPMRLLFEDCVMPTEAEKKRKELIEDFDQ